MAQGEKKRNGSSRNTLPDPLVPSEVDLCGFPGFVLNVDRLLASELVALGSPEECWAALMLWCRAWQQTPPASLPNDERVLASFSGAGRRWNKVKEIALRGFVECSDGRLYHRVLAEEATKAWKKRQQYQRDQERLKRWRAGQKTSGDTQSQTDETRFETRTEAVSEPEETATDTETATATATAITKAIAENDPARRLAEWFVALREELWPGSMPVAYLTLATEAQQHLDLGLTEAACMEVIERGARRHAKDGKSAIGSLRFFRNSMQDEAAARRGHVNGADTAAGDAVLSPHERDLSQWRARMQVYRTKGRWMGQWGPKPGEPGCFVPAEALQEGGAT